MRRFFASFLIALVPFATLVLGVWIGGHPTWLPDSLRDAFVGDESAQLYEEAMDVVEDDYFRKVKRDDLVDQSLGAAVRSLKDEFSAYLSPEDYKKFQEATTGEFEGVGMTVEEVKAGLRVTRVFAQSPAQRGGLRRGDVIYAVDGKSIAGQSSEQATSRIKGPKGTTVRLSWRHGRQRVSKALQRDTVDVPQVDSRVYRPPGGGPRIVRVQLSQFGPGAHSEVSQAVERGIKHGAKGVVLDLRGNGGGLLNEAVLVSSVFLHDGIVVSTKGRSRPEQVYRASGTPAAGSLPTVVLVDGGSASASEIVTGALQDRGRARVVGTKTFGKGVFQEIKRLSNGGALDITVGEYFTPKGRNLGGGGVKRGAGIKPDVKAEDDPKTKRDEALDRALREVARAGR